MKSLIRYIIIAFIILVLDQVTKGIVRGNFSHGETVSVISGFFSFTYVRNPGAAFGFMANAPEMIRRPLFLLIPVIACVWLAVLVWQVREKNRFLAYTYTLIWAGALGNLIDRFWLGYVVDFFDFYYGDWHYPAFNIADSAISIAAVLLIYDFLKQAKSPKDASDSV